MAAVRKRPLITANQVTLLRLLLIPIPCWMLYQEPRGTFAMWAVFIATLLGCTDFVDGYLARIQGPTVLGSLLDPIADKVFVAITWLPALTLLKVPAWWVVTLLFVREFFITALRSSYERRGVQLKSSYLSRYKTWVQMIGIGLFILFPVVALRSFIIFFATLTVLSIIGWLIVRFGFKRYWKGAVAFAGSFGAFTGLFLLFGIHGTANVLVAFVLVVTWWSGIEYLLNIGKMRGLGRIESREVVRLIGAIAVPLLAVIVQLEANTPPAIMITFTSVELAHGGFDNLLAHHRDDASALSWGGRVLVECLLLATILIVPRFAIPAGLLALVIAVVGFAVPLWTKRRYYLVDKLRTPAPAAASIAST